jgi:hypothetical protein
MRCWQDGGLTQQELSSLGPVLYKKGQPREIIFFFKPVLKLVRLLNAMKVFVMFGWLIFVKDLKLCINMKLLLLTYSLTCNLIILVEKPTFQIQYFLSHSSIF